MSLEIKSYTPQDYMSMIGKALKRVLKDRDYLLIFFGSVAKGKLKRTSDIDVALYLGEKIDPLTYAKIMEAVEELPILRDMDLVDLAEIKDLSFLKEILEGGLIWKSSKDLLESLRRRLEDTRKS